MGDSHDETDFTLALSPVTIYPPQILPHRVRGRMPNLESNPMLTQGTHTYPGDSIWRCRLSPRVARH